MPNLGIRITETVPCTVGTGVGDEATIIFTLRAVMVNATSEAGVILAPVDTDLTICNTDSDWSEVVTILCIKVTTLAHSVGSLSDTDCSHGTVCKYGSCTAEDVV